MEMLKPSKVFANKLHLFDYYFQQKLISLENADKDCDLKGRKQFFLFIVSAFFCFPLMSIKNND